VTTTIKKTIGVGKDYADLSSWFADIGTFANTNLVTADIILEAEVYGSISDNLTITGLTTNAAHYVHIYPAQEWRHGGYFTFGAKLLPITTDPILTILDDYIYVKEMIIEPNIGFATGHGVKVEGENILFDRCFFIANGGQGKLFEVVADTTASAVIKDCVLIPRTTSQTALSVSTSGGGTDSADVKVLNSTVINGPGNGFGVNATAGGDTATLETTNCLVMNMGGLGWLAPGGAGTPSYTGDYNAGSEISNAPGGSSFEITALASYLTTVTSGEEDIHLLDSSPLRVAGTSILTTVSSLWKTIQDLDIDHQLRQSSWCIGADQHTSDVAAISQQNLTSIPWKAQKHEIWEDYDFYPRFTWNRSMERLDTLLAQDTTSIASNTALITAAQGAISSQLESLLVNGDFGYWQRGTSFLESSAGASTDVWEKSANATVSQSNSYGTTSYSAKLKPQVSGATVYLHQTYFLASQLVDTTATFSCGIVSSYQNIARVGILAGTGATVVGTHTYSGYHPGSGTPTRFAVSTSLPEGTEWINVRLEITSAPSTTVSAEFFEAILVPGTYSSLEFVPSDPAVELYRVSKYYQKYSSVWINGSEQASSDNSKYSESTVVPLSGTPTLTYSSTIPTGVEAESSVNQPASATVASTQLTQFGNDGKVILSFGITPSNTLVNPDNVEFKSIIVNSKPSLDAP